jgi:hypothetical protein
LGIHEYIVNGLTGCYHRRRDVECVCEDLKGKKTPHNVSLYTLDTQCITCSLTVNILPMLSILRRCSFSIDAFLARSCSSAVL